MKYPSQVVLVEGAWPIGVSFEIEPIHDDDCLAETRSVARWTRKVHLLLFVSSVVYSTEHDS